MVPSYPWPPGTSGACVVSVDVDGDVPHLWRSREGGVRLAELEQRRFGPRVGLLRLLELFDRSKIVGSFYIPGQYAERFPQHVRAIVERGHEIGLHGYLHEPPTAVSKSDFAEALDRSMRALSNAGAPQPTGFRSPSWDMTPDAFRVLADVGLRYDSSMMGSDTPYMMGELIEVPVTWTLDDAPFYRYVGGSDPGQLPLRPSDLAARWRDELVAAEKFGTLAMLTVHDWLSGRPAAADALDQVLEHLAASSLWVATADDVARWHAELHPDVHTSWNLYADGESHA